MQQQARVPLDDRQLPPLIGIGLRVGESPATGPRLDGLLNEPVELASGQTVERDRAYLWRAIVAPRAEVVADYPPQLMPDYAHLDQQTVVALVEYLASLEAP